jgi:hypothetical protein
MRDEVMHDLRCEKRLRRLPRRHSISAIACCRFVSISALSVFRFCSGGTSHKVEMDPNDCTFTKDASITTSITGCALALRASRSTGA